MKEPAATPPEKEKKPLDAALAENAAKLVKQGSQHKKAAKNARAEYAGRIDALKKSVGGLAVQHGLVRLTANELEGLFIEAAAAITDPTRTAEWAAMGEAAQAKRDSEREAKSKPKQAFHFGRSKQQPEALEKSLRACGFKLSTSSARYWKLSAVSLPEAALELARNAGEKLWTYDEDGDKVMIFEPAAEKAPTGRNQLPRRTGFGPVPAPSNVKPSAAIVVDTGSRGEKDAVEPASGT